MCIRDRVLTVNASNDYYKDSYWAYSTVDKKTASFTIKVMSPIAEGTITPANEVFEHALEHEKHVSKLIDELVQVASEEKDNATQNFLLSLIHIFVTA